MSTWGKNFGHAISEALNLATLVIISDKTPWKNLQEKMAGWDLPLNEKKFTEVLQCCLKMDNAEYLKLSNAAFELGKSVSHNLESVEQANWLFD